MIAAGYDAITGVAIILDWMLALGVLAATIIPLRTVIAANRRNIPIPLMG